MDETGQLAGKVALLTGATGGLGRAQARLFVERGARVVLCDVVAKAGKELAAELGDHASFQALDVRSEEAWQSAVARSIDHFGSLDVLVHNAGVSPTPSPLHETSLDDYRNVIEINQIGTFLGLRTVIPVMLEADGGSIVLLSSTAGTQPADGLAPYSSSKFAVRALARVAALENARSGIRVNCILPGPMDTPMNMPGGWWEDVDLRPSMAATNPSGRVGEPTECAEMAAFLASDSSRFCTGGDYPVDGGQLAGVFIPPTDSSVD